MSFPVDYFFKGYPQELRKHRVSKETIDAQLTKKGEAATGREGYEEEGPIKSMKNAVHFVPCEAYRTLVPVSVHPDFTQRQAELEFLFRVSTLSDLDGHNLEPIPKLDLSERICDTLSRNTPVWLRNTPPRYPPGMFQIPTT
ncbi:hypothetical protein M407DRAFT_33894 [Tulasnella calospora MUT 4182]|uniref:Uncharacterized protein n=1 Tax=Tulasnella calospora MUT 4182 TaxID=1051891 RepID=A0A0C3K4Z0_9AGAM|nr:hypothetical protein M407DRAFT_33894 [Tulasnella calospora MUT 4182]